MALSSICNVTAADDVHSTSFTYWYTPMWMIHRPTVASELVGSSKVHLHALMSIVTADHILCVQPEHWHNRVDHATLCGVAPAFTVSKQTSSMSENEQHWQQLLYVISLAWAYTSKGMAHQNCKASFISRGLRHLPGWFSCNTNFSSASGAALGSLACGIGKSLFMENRKAYGVALDLDNSGTHLSTALALAASAQRRVLLCSAWWSPVCGAPG